MGLPWLINATRASSMSSAARSASPSSAASISRLTKTLSAYVAAARTRGRIFT
jgi:hypothetical protein